MSCFSFYINCKNMIHGDYVIISLMLSCLFTIQALSIIDEVGDLLDVKYSRRSLMKRELNGNCQK